MLDLRQPPLPFRPPVDLPAGGAGASTSLPTPAKGERRPAGTIWRRNHASGA